MIAAAAIMAFLAYLAIAQMNYKEITWKEFVNQYLSRGIVRKFVCDLLFSSYVQFIEVLS